MDTNVREHLLAAIRDYKHAAGHISSARNLLQALEAVERDIETAPNPVSQGAGSMPLMRPGASGQRTGDSPQEVHIHIGGSPKEMASRRFSA